MYVCIENQTTTIMEKQKSPLSIRVIYWLTNIASFLYLFTSVTVVVLVALLLFDVIGDDVQLHTDFPVKIDFLNEGTLQLKETVAIIQVVEAHGSIHFIDTPKTIIKSLLPILFVIIPIFGYLLWVFRNFIMNVKRDIIFDNSNITYLKRLAYGLMSFWFVCVVYARVFYYTLAKNIEIENAEVSSEFPEYAGILLVGLFIWMLAHIFKVGLDLQKEKELTI